MLDVTKKLLSCAVSIGCVGLAAYMGYTHMTGVFTGTARGYGGDITAYVKIEDSRLISIDVKAEGETPAVGGAAIPILVEEMLERQSAGVDVVSGATASSIGLMEAVDNAVARAGITLVSAEDNTDLLPPVPDENYRADVVVVGGGGAGLTAAVSAAEAGKSVILLEKGELLGGNTAKAASGMNAAQTHYEEEQGVEDSPQLFASDTMAAGEEQNNPELVQYLAEQSGKAVEWLDEQELPLSAPLVRMTGESASRTHRPLDENSRVIDIGSFLVDGLAKKAKESGVLTMTETEVYEIIMENEKAAGVRGMGKRGNIITVNSSSVIIATGGFGGDLSMVARYRPDLKGYISTNVSTVSGDAIYFLEAVGADFTDMDKIQLNPTAVSEDGALAAETILADGAILVNQEGKRFVNETDKTEAVCSAEIAQEGGSVWLFMDRKMYDSSPVIQDLDSKGYLLYGETLSDLAQKMGCNTVALTTLTNTLKRWANSVAAGKDEDFGRPIDKNAFRSDLSEGPYYAVDVCPGIHHCMGGVKIDQNARVISVTGEPIPGLFACGEVTGGIHGADVISGNAISDALVFGRTAGENAAKEN